MIMDSMLVMSVSFTVILGIYYIWPSEKQVRDEKKNQREIRDEGEIRK